MCPTNCPCLPGTSRVLLRGHKQSLAHYLWWAGNWIKHLTGPHSQFTSAQRLAPVPGSKRLKLTFSETWSHWDRFKNWTTRELQYPTFELDGFDRLPLYIWLGDQRLTGASCYKNDVKLQVTDSELNRIFMSVLKVSGYQYNNQVWCFEKGFNPIAACLFLSVKARMNRLHGESSTFQSTSLLDRLACVMQR